MKPMLTSLVDIWSSMVKKTQGSWSLPVVGVDVDLPCGRRRPPGHRDLSDNAGATFPLARNADRGTAPGPQHRRQLLGGHRHRHQVPLAAVASQLEKLVDGGSGLDALGDDAEVEGAARVG